MISLEKVLKEILHIYIYGIGVKSVPHGAAASATCEGK